MSNNDDFVTIEEDEEEDEDYGMDDEFSSCYHEYDPLHDNNYHGHDEEERE